MKNNFQSGDMVELIEEIQPSLLKGSRAIVVNLGKIGDTIHVLWFKDSTWDVRFGTHLADSFKLVKRGAFNFTSEELKSAPLWELIRKHHINEFLSKDPKEICSAKSDFQSILKKYGIKK